MIKKCAKCGAELICQADDIQNCWCTQIELKEYDSKYEDCLCRRCLEKQKKSSSDKHTDANKIGNNFI